METKIDIYGSAKQLEKVLARIRTKTFRFEENREHILAFDDFNANRRLGVRRRMKMLNHLAVLDGLVDVPFFKVDKEHLRSLVTRFRNDEIQKSTRLPSNLRKNQNYGETTKRDFLKIFRHFERWLVHEDLYKGKNPIFMNDRFLWYNRKDVRPEPVILTQKQIETLIPEFHGAENKAAITLMFDIGSRPEETFNIRYKDVTWDAEKKKYFVQIRFNKENSYPRTVDAPFSTEALNAYLATDEAKQKDGDSPLFTISPVKLRQKLQYFARKLFNLDVDLYTLRHSSIQMWLEFYGGSVVWMANRFGWSYASAPAELKTYLARSKCLIPDRQELARVDTIGELTNENFRTKVQLEQVQTQMMTMERNMALLGNIVRMAPELMEMDESSVPPCDENFLSAPKGNSAFCCKGGNWVPNYALGAKTYLSARNVFTSGKVG